MTSSLEVLATGPLVLAQDGGRPGLAAVGVGRSGAADRTAHRLGARLVGALSAVAAAGLFAALVGERYGSRGRLAAVWFGLPETHPPADRVALHPKSMVRDYARILVNPRFQRLAAAGAFNFAALFLYIASAPAFVLDLLRALGSHIDRDIQRDRRQARAEAEAA